MVTFMDKYFPDMKLEKKSWDDITEDNDKGVANPKYNVVYTFMQHRYNKYIDWYSYDEGTMLDAMAKPDFGDHERFPKNSPRSFYDRLEWLSGHMKKAGFYHKLNKPYSRKKLLEIMDEMEWSVYPDQNSPDTESYFGKMQQKIEEERNSTIYDLMKKGGCCFAGSGHLVELKEQFPNLEIIEPDELNESNQSDINEDIKVPIKVGDTILGGRFKNKKMVVKKIGKNAKGDITVNDKPLLKYRILKESNLVNQLSEEIEFVNDILLELRDSGYDVNIRTHSVYGVSHPGLTITIGGKLLPIDIGEYLLTIHSYLSEKGYLGFKAYDYDNEYSQSRHKVRVKASLKGIDNNFERDLPNFVDMLTRFTHNAPFDSVSVSYYKPNESKSIIESHSINELESDIRDILISELPEDVNTEISRIRKDVEIDPERYLNKTRTDLYLEIYIRRPWNSPNRNIPGVVNPEGGYPGNLLFWYEIKEAIIRLTNWYYSVYAMYDPIDKDTELRIEKDKSPLRFFTSGIEMYIGFNKEEDFDKIYDFISFTNFRMVVKL